MVHILSAVMRGSVSYILFVCISGLCWKDLRAGKWAASPAEINNQYGAFGGAHLAAEIPTGSSWVCGFCYWVLGCDCVKAESVIKLQTEIFQCERVCAVKRDHVAHTVSNLPAASPPALPTSELCSVLAACVVDVVSLHGNSTDLPAHSKHSTWQTKGDAGCCGNGGSGPCGSVSGCAVRFPACRREALHAARCSIGLVRCTERHPLSSCLPTEHSQCSARHHDARLGHLQPWHGRDVPAGAEWGLSVPEYIRTHKKWWVPTNAKCTHTFFISYTEHHWFWFLVFGFNNFYILSDNIFYFIVIFLEENQFIQMFHLTEQILKKN